MEQENAGSRLAALLKAKALENGKWRTRSVAQGETIFEPLSRQPSVHVLESGLVKLFYLVANGDEWTKSYIVDRGVFGPGTADNAATDFGAKAVEACELGLIDARWVSELIDSESELSSALADFQAWLFERKRRREEDLLCLSPEDRYLAFIEREGALTERLEQQEIAAFLRVTPVALSRIRRRLKQADRLAN